MRSGDLFGDAGPRPAATAQLLALDPGLGAGLTPEQRRLASDQAWARVVELPPGPATFAREPERFVGWLGLLVLDGLMLRQVEVGRSGWPELLGTGDLMRPWTTAGETVSSIPVQARFEAVARTRVALLDRAFALRVSAWPEIAAALLDRAVERSRWLAHHLAAGQAVQVDERIWIVLWHLADRWGRMTPHGVELQLPALSHRVLSTMVGAHRSTVTLAVRRLHDDGLLTHERHHGWTLLGSPDAVPSSSGAADQRAP